MKKRILKTLEDTLMINRAFMETKDILDLEEQIEAVKCSIAAETVVTQTTVEDGSSALFELIGFVFCNGKNDYEYWEVGLPELVQNKIMEILDDYDTWGCSIRGTAAELCEEALRYEED